MRLSIVIPLYNKAKWIERAIDSVLNQTFQDFEIIVVDDGSTDGSDKIVENINDVRIRLIRQQNAGASAARNTGIKESQGELIAFLDADDWWVSNKIEKQYELLYELPFLVWVASGFDAIHLNTKKIKYPLTNGYKQLLSNRRCFEDFYVAALSGVIFFTTTMIIKKNIFDEVGLFDTSMKIGEDRDLWYRIAEKYPQIGYVDASLAIYDERNEGTLTKSQTSYSEDMRKVIEKHTDPSVCFNKSNTKHLFLRKEILRALRHCARLYEKENIRYFLKKYKHWLPTKYFLIYGVLATLPTCLLRWIGIIFHFRHIGNSKSGR